MARPRGFRPVLRSKRPTDWTAGPGGEAGAGAAISAIGKTVIGSGIGPTFDGFTIVRTHGQLSFVLLTAAAAGDGFMCAFGQGIVSADAFAIGVTAMPGPLTDMSWPGWYYHQIYHAISTDSSPAASDTLTQVSIDLGSKSMRKLGLNEIAFLMIEVIEIGTATAEVFGMTRTLIKD